MGLQRKHLHMVLLWWLVAVLAVATTEASQTIRSGCEEKCGNVSIPFPFGTSKGCYLNEDFLITCNRTFNPPIPQLQATNIEVLSISLDAHELRIHTYVARTCYDGKQSNQSWASVYLKKFPLSSKRNKFTAVGCDTFSIMAALQGDDEQIRIGCMSFCASPDSSSDGVCSGVGCCQSLIPEWILLFNGSVEGLFNRSTIMDFSPCSYYFLVEEAAYNFSTADLKDMQNRSVVPTVLDWAVGNLTCEEAQKNTSNYACPKESVCNGSSNGPGYRCNCPQGYKGNPYLPLPNPDGCQDIDECKDSTLNDCTNSCHNIPGSYKCSCPKGYHGDGKRSGQGCTIDPLLLIKVSVGVGTATSVLIAIGLWSYLKHEKRQKKKMKQTLFKRNGGLLLEQQISLNHESVVQTKVFRAEELEKATDNFNENRVLGKGGLGTVYKGMLSDGSIVAVKKSNIVDENQIGQFINEVIILSHIIQRNIVKLLGCCLETEVPLLVYEYVSNGTLSDQLHVHGNTPTMSWNTRLRIAGEIAGALTYMHSYAFRSIFHRDIKSSNILLDENYRAVVSDFGISRSVPLNKTHLTTMVGGTFGYLDPEYFQSGQFTDKSDVYAFGVVLAELLTGKEALSSDRSDECLVLNFRSSMKQNRLFEILEPVIVNDAKEEEIQVVATLAKRCLKLNARKRPNMKEIAAKLDQLRKIQEPLLLEHSSSNSYAW